MDKQWDWLMREMESNGNVNSIASSIIRQASRTGHNTVAVVGKLISIVKNKQSELETTKKEKVAMEKVHEEEKNNWQQVIFKLSSSTEISREQDQPSDSKPNLVNSKSEGTPSVESLAVPKRTRAKSPKHEIQRMVDAQSTDLTLEDVDEPKSEVYPEVIHFRRINARNITMGTTTFLCVRCKTVIASCRPRNNQRSFAAHMQSCPGVNVNDADEAAEEREEGKEDEAGDKKKENDEERDVETA